MKIYLTILPKKILFDYRTLGITGCQTFISIWRILNGVYMTHLMLFGVKFEDDDVSEKVQNNRWWLT